MITDGHSRTGILLLKQTSAELSGILDSHPLLSIVEEYYHECSTICDIHKLLQYYVPEHERERHENTWWLKAHFDDY